MSKSIDNSKRFAIIDKALDAASAERRKARNEAGDFLNIVAAAKAALGDDIKDHALVCGFADAWKAHVGKARDAATVSRTLSVIRVARHADALVAAATKAWKAETESVDRYNGLRFGNVLRMAVTQMHDAFDLRNPATKKQADNKGITNCAEKAMKSAIKAAKPKKLTLDKRAERVAKALLTYARVLKKEGSAASAVAAKLSALAKGAADEAFAGKKAK